MEPYFLDLTRRLNQRISGAERLFCWLSGERSDFVRFNRGKIRQAGHVQQATVRLQLVDRQRQASAELSLTSNLEVDLAVLTSALSEMRGAIQDLPEDPHLLFSEEPFSSRSARAGDLPPGTEMAADVVSSAEKLDLVGLLSRGPIFRGFASSLGHQGWHEATSVLLDTSIYLQGDQAIKDSHAGFSWDPQLIRARIEDAGRRLSLLARPRRTLQPGRYRAYLAPAALGEIFGLLSWGGFSAKALRTKQSAMVRLQEAERALSPMVTISEKTSEGLAPAFQPEGFLKPAEVPLVEKGRFAGALMLSRTAKEYGISTNGAGSAESPEALDMAPGALEPRAMLEALGTGLLINNLWYLNYSDRGAGRMTGMTRFATFWVENGEIIGPTPVMRFDDSLYDLFGERLEALSTEREFFPDPTTYGERQTTSMRLPGALLSGLTLTL